MASALHCEQENATAVTRVPLGSNSGSRPVRAPDPVRRYTITFLTVALLAGISGYFVTTGAVAVASKILCVIFSLLFVGSLLYDPKRKYSEL